MEFDNKELQSIILETTLLSVDILINKRSQKNLFIENTNYMKELLKNYFILKSYVDNAISSSLKESRYKKVFSSDEVIILNSVKEDVENTKAVINHFENSLNIFKNICIQNERKKLQYKIFEEVFLNLNNKNYDFLAKQYNVSVGKIKNYNQESIEELTQIFFIDFYNNLLVI